MWSLSLSLSFLAIPGASKIDAGQVRLVVKASRWPQDTLESAAGGRKKVFRGWANHKGNQHDEMRLRRRKEARVELGGLDGVGGADRTDQRFRQQRLDPAQWGLAPRRWACDGMSPGLPWTPPRRDPELGASHPAQSRAAAPVCSAPSGSSAGRDERLLVRSPTLRSAQHSTTDTAPQRSTLTTRHAPGHTLIMSASFEALLWGQ